MEARIFQTYQSWRLDRTLDHQQASAGAFLMEGLDRVSAELTGGHFAPHFQSMPEFRQSNAAPRASSAPRPLSGEGALFGRIEIPRIGLSAIVLEGDDEAVLRKAVGHVPSTSSPGEPGNVVIAGHRDTFFRALKSIQRDDHIALVTPGGTFGYQVGSIALANPKDVRVLRSTGYATLTLITCYPFEYIGSAPKRFVVQAREIDTSLVTDQKLGPPSEQALQRSHPAAQSSSRPQTLLAATGQPTLTSKSLGVQAAPAQLPAAVLVTAPAQTSDESTEAEEVATSSGSHSRPHRVITKVGTWFGSLPKRLAKRYSFSPP